MRGQRQRARLWWPGGLVTGYPDPMITSLGRKLRHMMMMSGSLGPKSLMVSSLVTGHPIRAGEAQGGRPGGCMPGSPGDWRHKCLGGNCADTSDCHASSVTHQSHSVQCFSLDRVYDIDEDLHQSRGLNLSCHAVNTQARRHCLGGCRHPDVVIRPCPSSGPCPHSR